MPGPMHETEAEMFRRKPSLTAVLLARLGIVAPPHARVEGGSADLTEVVPADYRADAVTIYRDTSEQAVQVVIVEIQNSTDLDKAYTWPQYLTSAHARWRCPATLLVVCPDPKIARWAARQIDIDRLGPMFVPIVIGPDQLPPDVAASSDNPVPEGVALETAVLAVLLHAGGPGSDLAQRTLLEVLTNRPDELVGTIEMVLAALPSDDMRHLEDLMTASSLPRYRPAIGHEYYNKGHAAGQAQGELDGLRRVLRARGLHPTPDQQARMDSETDLEKIGCWIDRAVVATTITEVLD